MLTGNDFTRNEADVERTLVDAQTATLFDSGMDQRCSDWLRIGTIEEIEIKAKDGEPSAAIRPRRCQLTAWRRFHEISGSMTDTSRRCLNGSDNARNGSTLTTNGH